jgi:hypothetical protein
MKIVAVFLFLAIFASETLSDDPRNAKVLKYEYDNIGIDGYNFL